MEAGVPGTPRRGRSKRVVERKVSTPSRRKSLFGLSGVSPLSSPDGKGCPDLQDVCPQSPSWSEDSPRKHSPTKTQNAFTPVKALQDDFTQMALERTPRRGKASPQTLVPATPQSVTKTPRTPLSAARRSPRFLAGVRPLSPDRGVISPMTFYGKRHSEIFGLAGPHTDGKTLYRRIRESVRVRLPMETIPREKKRARSGGSGSSSVKRPKKRFRLFEDEMKIKPNTKKRSSPAGGGGAEKAASLRSRDKSLEEGVTLLARTPVSSAKKNKGATPKPTYNWQFFNSKTPTVRPSLKPNGKSPKVLTPPPTVRKRKLISSFDHLSCEEPPVEEDKENSSHRANSCGGLSPPLSSPPQEEEDFSEPETEDVGKKNVDELLAELNKEVTQVLGDEAVEEAHSVETSPEKTIKLFPIFSSNRSSVSQSPNINRNPPAASAVVKRRKLDPTQLILDVGQKGLKEVECTVCGLLYVSGDDTDEALHNDFHLKSTILSCSNWKSARCIMLSVSGDRVVLVKSGDPKAHWDKVKAFLELVDAELGYPPEAVPPSQVYLYLKKKEVAGVLTARPLSRAHRVLPSLGLTDTELCTEEEFPVKVGISRIWVSARHRRTGVATSLIDYLRRNFSYGELLKDDDIALSSPTEDGKQLAIKYFRREDYLIYTFPTQF